MRAAMLGVLAVLGFVPAAWMLFDGSRRLLLGDYVRIDGQLGPWTHVVSAVGLDPMGLIVATLFVACGVARAAATVMLLARAPWGWHAMLASSVMILWYLPVGTAGAILTFVIMLVPPMGRAMAGG